MELSQSFTGVIKFFSEQGSGFIQFSQNGTASECFFHSAKIIQGGPPMVGKAAFFDLKPTTGKLPTAINLRIGELVPTYREAERNSVVGCAR